MAIRRKAVRCGAAAGRRPGLYSIAMLGLWLGGADASFAHAPGLGAASIEVHAGGRIDATVSYAWSDLAGLLEPDGSLRGSADWPAVRGPLTELAGRVLQLEIDGNPLAPDELVVQPGAEDSVVYTLRFQAAAGNVAISSPLLAQLPRGQRLFIDIRSAAGAVLHQRLLDSGSAPVAVQSPASALQSFGSFVGEGIYHIWIGYDHLAFLALLLLPALVSRDRRDGLLQLARIVTLFSLTHSLSMSAAALGWIRLPERPVEIAIAVSVVLAGLANLSPGGRRRRELLAGGFGLLHGLGFASALAALGIGERPFVNLLAFNLGVEAGQLCAIALIWPVSSLLAGRRRLAGRLLPVGSLAIAALATGWVMQRLHF